MKKILIACPSILSTFIKKDYEILSKYYYIDYVSFDELFKPKIIAVHLTILKKLLFGNFDCLIFWFSIPKYSLLTLLSKVFKKKVVIISGGYDIAYVPIINWGEMGIFWKRIAQKLAFLFTDHIFAFSEFSKKDIIKYTNENKVSVLYFEIDTTFFTPNNKKDNLIVTTCYSINYTTIIQKGIDIFLECAKAFPDYKFIIIGNIDKKDKWALEFLKNSPKNVFFTNGFIPNELLRDYYKKAKIYIQASAHEGFGIAVAEAMACGCIPIGTRNTSLKEVINDERLLFDYGDINGLISIIKSIINGDFDNIDFRKIIVEHFSEGRREKKLISSLNILLSS